MRVSNTDSDSGSFFRALQFWIRWSIATGMGVGLAHAITLFLLYFAAIAVDGSSIGVTGVVVILTIPSLISAPFIPGFQQLVLGLPSEFRRGWKLLTCLAWIMTSPIISVVIFSLMDRSYTFWGLRLNGLICIVAAGIAGAVFGVCQWFVFRHIYPRSGWWITASILGWVLFYFVHQFLFGMDVLGEMVVVTTGFVGGLLMGMVTGIAIIGIQDRFGHARKHAIQLSGVTIVLLLGPALILTRSYSQQRMTLHAPSPDAEVLDVAFSPDGTRLATIDDQISLWDVDHGKRIKVMSLGDTFHDRMSFSSDGRSVAVTEHMDDKVILWNVDAGEHRFIPQLEVNEVVFSPNGKLLAIGTGDFDSGSIILWDVVNDQHVRVLAGQRWVNRIAFSPDGQYLASGSDAPGDNSVFLWEANTGKMVHVFLWRDGGITGVQFFPDGKYLIAGGSTRKEGEPTLRIWNLESYEEVQSLHITTDIESMALSPDGKLLAITIDILRNDSTIYLYDLSTGQLFDTLRGHIQTVLSLRFSPDGRYLASGSFDGTARIWDVPTRGRSSGSE